MAVALRTSAAGGSSSGTSNRTVTIVPAVGDLLVIYCCVASNTNDTPTCSDNNSGTYTRIDILNFAISTVNYRMSVFVRDSLMVNTTSTVVTVATGSNTSGAVHALAISGMSRVGTDAVRSKGLQNNQAAGTAAPVLNQNALTGNLTIVALGSGDTTTTPPTNWTEAQDTSFTNETVALETATRASGFTNTTITFGAASSTAFCSHAMELDSTAPAVDLVAQNASHAHSAANLALTQDHSLVVANGSHAQAAENLIVGHVHSLILQDGTHGHSADTLALTQSYQLITDNSSHAHNVESLTLTQVHSLSVASGSHGHTATNLSFTQAHELVINGGAHDHSAESLALAQSVNLIVQNAAHGHDVDPLVLTQAHVLSVQDATHNHSSGVVTLTQAHVLAVEGADHAQFAGGLVLFQSHELSTTSAVHVQIASSLTVVQAHSLSTNPSTHSHAADNIALGASVAYDLNVASAFHAHSASNISAGLIRVTETATVPVVDRITIVPSMSRSASAQLNSAPSAKVPSAVREAKV